MPAVVAIVPISPLLRSFRFRRRCCDLSDSSELNQLETVQQSDTPPDSKKKEERDKKIAVAEAKAVDEVEFDFNAANAWAT